MNDPDNLDDSQRDEPLNGFGQADAFLRELRDALQPEPLPNNLLRTVRARVEVQTVIAPRTIPYPIRLAGLSAAAAALLLAVVGTQNVPVTTAPTSPATMLTSDDATDIVAACALLGWSGATDYSLERVTNDLNALDKRIEREDKSQAGLPWNADDDWDTPVKGRGASTPQSPNRIPVG